MSSDTLNLTIELINRPSLTPDDAGCQDILAARLAALGFKIERLPFENVDNLYARSGDSGPLLLFLGHTDVVPTGPAQQWTSAPFEATIADGYLYGRGAADMKGELAAMLTAIERFSSNHKSHSGSIAYLATSDEEGLGINGTARVVEHLQNRGEKIDWCLVGEPSSNEVLGDTIKNGRRGSLSGKLMVTGIQGHVAYPERARNPIHLAAPAISELCAQSWDQGNQFFPPTSFQISNIHGGTGADNVIPGQLEVMFNFRYSTELAPDEIKTRVHSILDKHGLTYSLDWRLSGHPFLTPAGLLLEAVRRSFKDVAGIEPAATTTGGTSDGRFLAPLGTQIVEAGLVNTTIHKVNECVKVDDLETLSRVYERLLELLLMDS